MPFKTEAICLLSNCRTCFLQKKKDGRNQKNGGKSGREQLSIWNVARRFTTRRRGAAEVKCIAGGCWENNPAFFLQIGTLCG